MNSSSLQIPSELEHAVEWLTETLLGECGPDHPTFPVPLRHLVIKGGRGSGKSHGVARIISNICRHMSIRALCTRETQKSIEESVYQLLSDCQHEIGIDSEFTYLKTHINHQNGSQILFAGLRAQDVNKLKSTERIKIAWVEEAHAVTEKSLQVLAPTIRDENSVIIYTYNPELDDDPVHKRYAVVPADNVCVVTMNYRENPWFPEVLEAERLADYERDESEGKVIYNWIWEGQCLPAVEGAIFAAEVARFQEQHRYRLVDADPIGKVHGIMDLGYGVMTMVLAQRFGNTVQIVGYREWRNSTYARITKDLRTDPRLADYRWGKIFMPHDAAHRDPKTGLSHKDVMEDLDWDVEDVEQIGVENYIEQGRRMFGQCYINTENGGDLLMGHLKRFKYNISEAKPDKRMAPDKDDHSHGSEAFCYTAVVAEQLTNDDNVVTNPYEGLDSGYAA